MLRLSKDIIKARFLERYIRRALLLWYMNTEEVEGIKFPVSSSLRQVKLIPNDCRKL